MFRERRRPSERRAVVRRARRKTDEATFQDQIQKMAEAFGWLWFHVYDSRRSPPGFPDLTMVRDGRIVFAELKTEGKKPREEQKIWLAALGKCPGVEVYLWRPSDAEEIMRILTSP